MLTVILHELIIEVFSSGSMMDEKIGKKIIFVHLNGYSNRIFFKLIIYLILLTFTYLLFSTYFYYYLLTYNS